MRKRKVIKAILKISDVILKNVFLTILLFILLFAVFIEFDTYKMLKNAESSNYQYYKPYVDDSVSFEELKKINPDVIGWLTIDNTGIDYPIVQGESNNDYVNTSVFGEFSLTGAIFLDSGNSPDFSDIVSIIYGHNMVGNAMFGGIELFEEERYFNQHLTGTLYCGGEYYQLKIFAYFKANGYDRSVYHIIHDNEKYGEWAEYINAISINRSGQFPTEGHILLMSTCELGETDGRNLLAAEMIPGGAPPKKDENNKNKKIVSSNDPKSDFEKKNRMNLLIFGIILILVTLLYIWLGKEKSKCHQKNV